MDRATVRYDTTNNIENYRGESKGDNNSTGLASAAVATVDKKNRNRESSTRKNERGDRARNVSGSRKAARAVEEQVEYDGGESRQFEDRCNEFIDKARRPSTMLEVQRMKKYVLEYEIQDNITLWTKDKVKKMLLYLADKGQVSRVKGMLAILSEKFRREKIEDFTKDLDVIRMKKGIQKGKKPAELPPRLPLPVEVIHHYFIHMPKNTTLKTWSRNRVVLLLGFAGMRRPGEWEQVLRSDVRFDAKGWMYINMRELKTLEF